MKAKSKEAIESADNKKNALDEVAIEKPDENCEGIGSVPLPGSGGGKGKTEKK